MRRVLFSVGVGFTIVLAGLQGSVAQAQAPAPGNLPLLQKENTEYLGSFLVPASDGAGGLLSFGGILGLGTNGRSLIWSDHAWYKGVCEVSIPPLGGRAAILQPCADVDEGLLGQISPGATDTSVTGALAWNGRLVWSATSYYDANGTARYSHFTSGTSFRTRGDTQGPYRVGPVPVAASGGYFGVVPSEWRDAFGGPALTGNCCLSILWRTSSGPAVSVFDPDDLGRVNPIPATPLVYYPIGHPLAPHDSRNPLFNQSTQVAAVAFPTGSRSVLFVGRHGLGDFCYGDNSKCVDPSSSDKGGHAYPYQHQVWAYDALDLLAVARGTRQPWEVRPYATWRLTGMDTNGAATVAGATFDINLGRLYIAQRTGEGDQRVHVYQVGDGVRSTEATNIAPPGPPSGLVADVRGSQVDLQWVPPVTGGSTSGYSVEAGTVPGGVVHQQAVSATPELSIPDVGTEEYYVRVRATNEAGVSAASNEVLVTAGCPNPPSAPQALSVRVNGHRVSFTWRRNETCDSRFRMLISSSPGANDLASVDLDAPGFTTYAPPGTYFVQVVAVSGDDVSAPSNEVRVFVSAPGR